MTGKIKTRNIEKGYGFISQEGGDDIFFHKSELKGVTFEELQDGDSVTFEKVQGEKGWNATGVERAE